MEIRKITAGLILGTLTTFSWGDGHGHNLRLHQKICRCAGRWEGNFRFSESSSKPSHGYGVQKLDNKKLEDKLKFAMTSSMGNATTEQPIASEWLAR